MSCQPLANGLGVMAQVGHKEALGQAKEVQDQGRHRALLISAEGAEDVGSVVLAHRNAQDRADNHIGREGRHDFL